MNLKTILTNAVNALTLADPEPMQASDCYPNEGEQDKLKCGSACGGNVERNKCGGSGCGAFVPRGDYTV